jgi:hypothetical protein
MRRFPVIALSVFLTVAVPSASAAERFVTPSGGATSGSCAETTPCTLATAVTGAVADDEVVVPTGTYDLSAPLVVNVRLTIRGIPGEIHPKIRGAFSTPTVSLEAGGRLSHLALSSSGLYGEAAGMRGGVFEDSAAVSTGVGSSGLVATSENGGLLVRDSAFRAWGSDADGAAIHVSGAGSAKLLNVTAYADTGPTGITCAPDPGGAVRLVNTLVRGAAADVTATSADCSARFSNFRPANTTGVDVVGNNQSADPQLTHVPSGNFRPVAGSPAIDAGVVDPDLGPRDLDGQARWMGQHPDIGAYEQFVPEPPKHSDPEDLIAPPALAELPAAPRAAAPEPATAAAPAAPAAPKLGKSVVLDATQGKVLVKTPGGKFVPLSDATNLPVGTVIDTRNGAVTLEASVGGGKEQTGTFSGGMFTVRQDPKAKGMTDLFLTGGSSAACKTTTAKRTTARAAASKPKKAVRRLWGKDKSGRFRTHGSKSVATVRGTRWLTEDRCDGTYTKVVEGAVDVRSKRSGKVTRVKAGRDLLVK